MNCRDLSFSRHAVQRMFERAISPEEVRLAVDSGHVIAEYPEDIPFPSYLISFVGGKRPLHVVVATDREKGKCRVVTVYLPDPKLWETDFKTRKKL